VARPPKVLFDNPARDRFRRFQDDARWGTFNVTQKTRILAMLADHFGEVRF
jgi:hypothetical protein